MASPTGPTTTNPDTSGTSSTLSTSPSAVAAAVEAHVAVNEAAKAGVPVSNFDPDALSKAESTKSPMSQIGSVLKEKPPIGRELDVMGSNGASAPLPTIIVEDTAKKLTSRDNTAAISPATDAATLELPNSARSIASTAVPATPVPLPPEDEGAGMDGVPGALPGNKKPEIPEWFKVGWRQVSGIDDPTSATAEGKTKAALTLFLNEQLYGDWYHNAGIIIFAVLASHFMTRFRLGWGWLIVVLAFCNTYYSTSMERFRRNTRDDIQRELVKTRLASEHESAEWLNNFLDRFWRIYEPVLSQTISGTVRQILSTNTPTFLDSLSLPVFTLGNKAPRIDQVRTFPKTEDDIVMMDWGVSFTPNDTSDMTARQIRNKVNPKITLSVRFGKGLATAALPVLVEDVSFQGLLRIRMKLMTNFPHIQTVDITFLEKPVIDFVLKPIGGETFGFDIANLPGLSTFIRDMTHYTLGPLMYDPNVFTLNLEQMLSGKPLDAAIGVVEVTIRAARNIQGSKIGGGVPDPYVSLSINERAELARTRYKSNTYNPTWNETKYILINTLNEQLFLCIYDYNDHRKNSKIASAFFELNKLVEDAVHDDIVSPVLRDGKARGELRYDVHYYPVVEPELGKEEVADSTAGIVRLVLHQAKELDQSKSLSGDLNPFAKVHLDHSVSPSFQTPVLKHNNSPVWESPYEFLCTNKDNAVITVKIVDDRDFLKDPVIGYMSIKLVDLMEAKKLDNKDWFPLSGCKQGKLRLSAEWKPLAMAGALHGSDHYTPPIGVVRLVLEKATDVKNVEAMLGGKSDPYVRVQVENVTKGRTEVVNNNLNPVWDEIIYIPVHSLRETMMLECMDYQHLTKDRSLGYTELVVSDLAFPSPAPEDTQYRFKSNGVKNFSSPLRQDNGSAFKGTLHYTAEFVPAVALRNLKFESQDMQVNKISKKMEHGEDGGIVTDESSSEDDGVPAEVTIKSERKRGLSLKKKGSKESVASKATNGSDKIEKPGNGVGPKQEEGKGIEMTTEELLAQQSGIAVFHIVSGQLQKKGRLEVLLDDGYWPCFSTMKAHSTHAQWGYVGEGFIKEIDFSRVWLRLCDSDDADKGEILAEWKGDSKAFLENILKGPRTFELMNQDDKVVATIVLESRYVPVPVRLEARETVNNQGILRVDLIDGHDIRGVDRSGKSDPYVVFNLNDQKVFKSQTKKKTITPEWNEHFEVTITSRVVAEFTIEVFDWNQIEQAKSLGVGKIDVAGIEAFLASEQIVKLSTNKRGEKGEVRVRLVFQPGIIAKSRKPTSTLTNAGRAVTTIGGLPVSAGKGVFHGVAGVFKHKENNHQDGVAFVPTSQLSSPTSAMTSPSTGLDPVINVSEVAEGSNTSLPLEEKVATAAATNPEPGTLRVTILDAKDLSQHDVKPYVTLRVGDKEFKTKHTQKTHSPEWNETFIFAASTLTPKLFVWVHDHKTIGKDKDIGEGEIEIWRHVKPQGVSSADTVVELTQGTGLVRLRLEFDSSTQPNGSHPLLEAEPPMRRSISIPSPSRFGLRNLRANGDNDES